MKKEIDVIIKSDSNLDNSCKSCSSKLGEKRQGNLARKGQVLVLTLQHLRHAGFLTHTGQSLPFNYKNSVNLKNFNCYSEINSTRRLI